MAYLDPIDMKTEWDARKARHLLNRAGFGIPASAADKLQAMGAAKAVEATVNYEKYPDNITEPTFITEGDDPDSMMTEQRQQYASATPEERRDLRQEFQRQQRQQVEQLKTWWLQQMRVTNRPLQEKMAVFWHGHFATSAEKVKAASQNYEINKVFRDYATGNFQDLVFAVGKTPAMLTYLDNKQNKKGHPNENWSRELMELFTLGIGHYSEDDIKNAARAFSGYTIRGGKFEFASRDHDYGEKTFLGRTGNFDGADAINIILDQPQCARFISKKIWEYLAYEKPSEELVTELAAVLRDNNYEMKPLLSKIFLSKEFYSQQAMAGQIKSPAQYLVALTDHLNVELPRPVMITMAMRGLGQDLFYPPNVKGWEGNRTWINTNTILTRYNIPMYVVTGERPDLPRYRPLDEQMAPEGMMKDDGGDAMMAPVQVNAQQQMKRPEGRGDQKNSAATSSRREAFKKLVQERKPANAPPQQGVEKKGELRQAAQAARGKGKGGVLAAGQRMKIDLKPVMSPYFGKPANQAAAGMTQEFLGRPLDETQSAVLVRALSPSGPAATFTEAMAQQNGSAFLHLLLSTAEYQLC
ncbi:hypothetical protein BH09SUM1_BH09SUM1_06700 [soil metagenome]